MDLGLDAVHSTIEYIKRQGAVGAVLNAVEITNGTGSVD